MDLQDRMRIMSGFMTQRRDCSSSTEAETAEKPYDPACYWRSDRYAASYLNPTKVKFQTGILPVSTNKPFRNQPANSSKAESIGSYSTGLLQVDFCGGCSGDNNV